MIASIQVWEADQSGSRWCDALERALNSTIAVIDRVMGNSLGIATGPALMPVTIASEIARFLVSLMDVLRRLHVVLAVGRIERRPWRSRTPTFR
ncbi:hypothetical protein ACIRL2_45425 [Embleya sp. NPDC127516]|uniref:hypothetical protein n=1 Tax=Embleya sp. NPDC127516 TaxID=3363990 RepID=UPI0037FE130E